MALNPNEDTEFNDALRKHGILPPRELTPPSPSPPSSPTLDDVLNDFTPKELQELSEDVPDDETERLILLHRKQIIEEEQRQQIRARFDDVYPISRDDYTREVTEASRKNEGGDDEEKGTGVVCFLYKDGLPRSDRAFQQIRTLAKRYPRTKFVSIVGDKCIPNLPDSRVPMFILYRKGEIRQQIVAWGADRERQIEDPSQRKDEEEDEDDLEEEDDFPSFKMRSATTATNSRASKNIRSSQKDSSDSDFEFDM